MKNKSEKEEMKKILDDYAAEHGIDKGALIHALTQIIFEIDEEKEQNP